jgi:hypothetical protein
VDEFFDTILLKVLKSMGDGMRMENAFVRPESLIWPGWFLNHPPPSPFRAAAGERATCY